MGWFSGLSGAALVNRYRHHVVRVPIGNDQPPSCGVKCEMAGVRAAGRCVATLR